jgi:hypothetical protein
LHPYTSNFSIACLIVVTWLCSSLDSLVVTLAAITGRETLHARPRAAFDGTNMYGTFCKGVSVIGQVGGESHLLFAQEREMQQDLYRFCVGSENNEL